MKKRNWAGILLAVLAAALLAVAAWNVLLDPFGVFGDRLLRWENYNVSNAPAVAKPALLERGGEKFDSFLIGGSAALAYPVDALEEALGGSFYNLAVDGGGLSTELELARYAANRPGTRQLVLSLSLSDAAADGEETAVHAAVSGSSKAWFSLRYALKSPMHAARKLLAWRRDTLLPQSFDRLNAATGSYDGRVRDEVRIGAEQTASTAPAAGLPRIAEAVHAVEEIAALCAERGIRLTVILEPAMQAQLAACGADALQQLRTQLAKAAPFWDFSSSSVSMESRYFYPDGGFRADTARMMLWAVSGAEEGYVPADFGRLVQGPAAQGTPPQPDADALREVPVLMYHHLAADATNAEMVTPERFEAQLRLMLEAGYEPVSLQQLIDFVDSGGELPEKPVLITFDDGYLSNYELAWPILQRCGAKAAIFAIGTSFGKSTYKDTENPITPHFSYAQAEEMMVSGLVEVQSHTWDLHQWEPYENVSPARDCARQLPGESDAAYYAAIRDDLHTWAEAYAAETGRSFYALAWPKGVYTTLSELAAHEEGARITFSTSAAERNVLVRGLPQTLYALCRLGVTMDTTDEALLDYLAGN